MLPIQRLLLLLASLSVAAQVYTATGAATTTSSAPAATQSIQVGAAGNVFTPNTINANVGDILEFRFYPLNHSVARADFESPCIPYEDTGPGKVGFWSGFRPVAVVLSSPPIFQIVINDTNPLFFYCGAPGACKNDMMVGVVNPNAMWTLSTQEAYAMNSTLQFVPGEGFPVEALPSSAGTMTMTTTPATATATVVPADHGQSSSLSGGAIAGIVIGALIAIAIGAAVIYLCGRQKTMGEMIRQNHYPSNYGAQSPMTPAPGFYPQSPNAEISAMTRTFSGPGSPLDRNAGSPDFENDKRNMSPHQGSINGSMRPDSPLMDMSMPSPRYASPLNGTDAPGSLRIGIPQGPHEIMSNSDRDYVPGQSPGIKKKHDFSENEF